VAGSDAAGGGLTVGRKRTEDAPATPPVRIEMYPGAGVFIELMPVAKLAAAPYNPRTMKPERRAALEASLASFGLVQSPVFNARTGELIGGHQRVRWLRGKKVREVAVVVVDVDETTAKAMNVTLNAAQFAGEFSAGLGALLAQVELQAPTLYTGLDLGALVDMPAIPIADGAAAGSDDVGEDEDVDDADIDPNRPPTAKDGEMWILGEHRLLVGDSQTTEAIDRVLAAMRGGVLGEPRCQVVVTDPPYAIYGSSTGVGSDVADDKMVRPFFEAMWRHVYRVLPWEGHAYQFCDWRSWAAVWESAKRGGVVGKNMLVWDKHGSGLGNNYANTHELIGFFVKSPPKKFMKRSQKKADDEKHRPILRPNILRFPRPHGEERPHNAAKPVDLIAELITNSSDEGDVVLDMYGGGGSTLMAAERVGRRCAMIEIEPRAVDKIVARWERRTGGTAHPES
jgi:DNA modification methylase